MTAKNKAEEKTGRLNDSMTKTIGLTTMAVNSALT
jgi:hypothetical protein